MNTNLLKKTLIASFISSALAGCGVDEGLNYNIDSTEPVVMDSSSFTITTNETNNEDDANRYLTIELLQGVSSRGVNLIDDSTGIFIQDATELLAVSPVDRDLGFNNSQFPVTSNGKTLIVDTYSFDERITSNETAIYTLNYWINNGYQFTCANMEQHPFNCTDEEKAANPNRRTLTLEVNALPDPIESITLSDFNVPLAETMIAPLAILPAYTARQDLSNDFTWSVPANNGIASVDSSGTLMGLALGSTTLTVTSVEMPSLTETVTITVTNPPKNVASISLKTPNGNDVTGTITVPTCTSYDFTVAPVKQDNAQPFTGDFVYGYSSTEALSVVDYAQDTLDDTTKQEKAYFSPVNVGSSEAAKVILNGSTPPSSVDLDINTLTNVMCANAPMMNEDFKMAAPQQTRNIFKSLNSFARNGVGADATVDATGAYSVIVGMGKHGSDTIQYTAAAATGTNSVLVAYDKNPARNIGSVSLAAGGDFKVSFWIKNNNATSFKIENAIMKNTTKTFLPVSGDFTDSLLDQQGVDAIEIAASADWQLVELDVLGVAAFGANDRAKWDIIFVPSATDGSTPIDVYIDDVSIAELND
jgi:hypothetical protein